MREGIHPTYYPNAQVICACGNTWTTGSTQELIRTDVCSNCHPFFTGEQRIVDTAGQVDRFMRRLQQAEQRAAQQRIQMKAEEAARKAAAQARARGERPDKVKSIAQQAAGSVLAELEGDTGGITTAEDGDQVVAAEHIEEIVAEFSDEIEVTESDVTEVVDDVVTTGSDSEAVAAVDDVISEIIEDDAE